jgi:hypothetical protein
MYFVQFSAEHELGFCYSTVVRSGHPDQWFWWDKRVLGIEPRDLHMLSMSNLSFFTNTSRERESL